MKNTKLLEPGDVVYKFDHYDFYTKYTIERCTKTQAIASSFDKMKPTPESDGTYRRIGSWGYYELESPQVLQRIADIDYRKAIQRQINEKIDFCKPRLKWLTLDQLTRIAEIIQEPR